MDNPEKDLHGDGIISRRSMECMKNFLDQEHFCDATLKTEDGFSIQVNRAIMSVSSEYFMALFTTSLNSAPETEVTLNNVDSGILRQLVHYAYSRKILINDDNVCDLLITADYLSFLKVKELCCNYMCENLAYNNCVEVLMVAKNYFCSVLEEQCKIFILAHFEDVEKESSEFWQMDFSLLFSLLSDDRLNIKDEAILTDTIINWVNQDPQKRLTYQASLCRCVRLNREQAEPRLPRKVLFAIGGWSGGSPTSMIEIYDYKADKWTMVKERDPSGPRAYHGTVMIGTIIYVIGGFDGNEYFSSCRCFDIVSKTWKEIAPMHNKRCYISVAACQGFIYAMGGYDGHQRQKSSERYDPNTNQWSILPNMHDRRSDADACVLNNKIYITGGFNGHECLQSAEVWDPDTYTWVLITPMSTRRSGVSCIGFNGKLVVAGGFNGLSRLRTVEWYDPIPRIWSPLPEMAHNRSNFAIEVIDDKIIAMGGFNGITTVAYVETYTPGSSAWESASNMLLFKSALSACILEKLPEANELIQNYRSKIRVSISGTSIEEMEDEEDEDD